MVLHKIRVHPRRVGRKSGRRDDLREFGIGSSFRTNSNMRRNHGEVIGIPGFWRNEEGREAPRVAVVIVVNGRHRREGEALRRKTCHLGGRARQEEVRSQSLALLFTERVLCFLQQRRAVVMGLARGWFLYRRSWQR